MDAERVLVIKVRALGDTLLATPALAALRAGLPRARITAVVSPAGADVLAGNPDVDEIRIYDKTKHGLGYHLRFARGLAAGRFDLCVALHASFRTALLARASGARVRVVHNHSGHNFFSTLPIPTKKESKSAIQRDLDAVRALGLTTVGEQLRFAVDEDMRADALAWLRAQGLDAARLFVLVPGAGKARKRWTAAAAAALLDGLEATPRPDWVILAGPEDVPLAEAIRSRSRIHPPVFRGSLPQAAALLAASRGVITTDSGPKHLAVAVGARTLTLWTDEPEAEWHPYDLSRHALVRSRTGVVADIPAEAVISAAITHFGLKRPEK